MEYKPNMQFIRNEHHLRTSFSSSHQNQAFTRKQLSSNQNFTKTSYYQEININIQNQKLHNITNPELQLSLLKSGCDKNLGLNKFGARGRCRSLQEEKLFSQSPQKGIIYKQSSSTQVANFGPAHFVNKFHWKSIPKNLEVKNQRLIFNQQSNNQFLRVQKSCLYETKVSTNCLNSMETSKYIQNSNNEEKNQFKVEQENTQRPMDQISLFTLFRDYKNKNNLNSCEIQEIQSLSHSRISRYSSTSQEKNLVLDQSIVQWTFETGFIDNSKSQQQLKEVQ